MTSPAEIANDMDARAGILNRTQLADHGRAMLRAAACIRDQLQKVSELEAVAEAEAQAFERFKNGDVL